LATYPYVGAYISYLCCLSLKFGNSKFNVDHINLEAILTRIVLKYTGYKGLGKIEARYPVDIRFTVFDPRLEKDQSEQEDRQTDELSYFSIC